MLGTFLLVLFGCGAVHSAVLLGDLTGLWQVGIVWGLGIAVAIYAVGGISGAHINPAITLGMAANGLFRWKDVLPYVIAQLAGAFLAAACLFMLFHNHLAAKEQAKGVTRGLPGSEITAMCYGEYFPSPGPLAGGEQAYDPAEHAALNARVSEPVACFAEFLGTLVLALAVAALTHPRNPLAPERLAPLLIGLTVTALICFLAPLTQAGFNPARDLGPRLFAYLAGWGEIALPGPRGLGFVTVYLLSPISGAIAGTTLYHRLIAPALTMPAAEAE